MAAVAAGAGLIVAVQISGINANWLYLLLVLSVYAAAVCAIARAWAGFVLLVPLAVLALNPRRLVVPDFLDPAPPTDRQTLTRVIPEGQTWRYTFTLSDLDAHVAECGTLRATLYVDGVNLQAQTLDVRTEGTVPMVPPAFGLSNGLDNAVVHPVVFGVTRFSLLLTARPGETPAIRLGPEIEGTRVYSDAVYLELKNDRCTVIYETARTVEPAVPRGPGWTAEDQ